MNGHEIMEEVNKKDLLIEMELVKDRKDEGAVCR